LAITIAGISDPGYSTPDKIFTDRQIHRAPDCARACLARICLRVSLSPPSKLSDVDKLDALRRLDQFRQWHSLDEKRYCLVCGKIITGRQIQVAGETRGNGPLRVSCPTEQCNSIPMDWVLPTDEIIAKVEMMIAEERKTAVPTPATPGNGGHEHTHPGHNGIASRLRKFPFHFKRSA
jgi:hypothetical protein